MGDAVTHVHQPVRQSEPRAFSGPVAYPPSEENPMAHGNITVWQFCGCGARRRANINGRHEEHGPWETPPTEAVKRLPGGVLIAVRRAGPQEWRVHGTHPRYGEWWATLDEGHWPDGRWSDPFDCADAALELAVELARTSPALADWRAAVGWV